MTATLFSLSVHSIIMAETRLEFVGGFIVYMSSVSNVKITFGCVQFVSLKSRVYTFINIHGRTRYNDYLKLVSRILLSTRLYNAF